MSLPHYVRHQLTALGVGDAGQDTVEREMRKAQLMSREELQKAIELKSEAIKYLRIQQAAYLSVLEIKTKGY